jgi:hypothetical protein
MAHKPATDNGANEYKYPTFTSVIHAILWFAEYQPNDGESEHAVVQCFCNFCNAEKFLIVPIDALIRFEDGALVQDAFPMLSPAQRCLLAARICEVCWV